jgi:hypothetical protein
MAHYITEPWNDDDRERELEKRHDYDCPCRKCYDRAIRETEDSLLAEMETDWQFTLREVAGEAANDERARYERERD